MESQDLLLRISGGAPISWRPVLGYYDSYALEAIVLVPMFWCL